MLTIFVYETVVQMKYDEKHHRLTYSLKDLYDTHISFLLKTSELSRRNPPIWPRHSYIWHIPRCQTYYGLQALKSAKRDDIPSLFNFVIRAPNETTHFTVRTFISNISWGGGRMPPNRTSAPPLCVVGNEWKRAKEIKFPLIGTRHDDFAS